MNTAIIRTEQLSRSFGSVQAVNELSLEVPAGIVFAFLGPNGAGKTTTISVLSCLLKPTSGDAIIGGHSVTRESLQVREVIGVVPQDIALYNMLSARENLVFWGRMYGMGGAALKQRVNEVLEQIGLADRANAKVETYSGGMKRRANIGVGLLHQPRILYMDEPTVGIDPQSRRSILDTVKDLNKQGMTVLYTTHYMEEAQELSDRVGIIDHGQLIALGTQKELTQIVGGHDTLRLHIGAEDDAEQLAQALGQLPGVLKCSAAEQQVVLVVPEAEEALAPAITRANEIGMRIHAVDIQEPNLETVFLQLTGRALRDG
jgi:linearmycin/streptolysin S transport system ATP-binding protein